MSEQQAEAQVISEIKDKVATMVPDVVPTLPEATAKASAQSLKDRLQWGEPALTIIDTRDRRDFLEERITGAMLIDNVRKLPENREIYIYGNSNEKTHEVANNLRQAGFESISEIQGGLSGWKAVGGATEGRAA